MEPISGTISAVSATMAKLLQLRDKIKDGQLHRQMSTLLNELQDHLNAIATKEDIRIRRDKMVKRNEALWEEGQPYCWACAFQTGKENLVPLPDITGGKVKTWCKICGEGANINNALPEAPSFGLTP